MIGKFTLLESDTTIGRFISSTSYGVRGGLVVACWTAK